MVARRSSLHKMSESRLLGSRSTSKKQPVVRVIGEQQRLDAHWEQRSVAAPQPPSRARNMPSAHPGLLLRSA